MTDTATEILMSFWNHALPDVVSAMKTLEAGSLDLSLTDDDNNMIAMVGIFRHEDPTALFTMTETPLCDTVEMDTIMDLLLLRNADGSFRASGVVQSGYGVLALTGEKTPDAMQAAYGKYTQAKHALGIEDPEA